MLDIPVWGQWSVAGLLLGLIGFVIVSVIRGDLTTAKHLQQEMERSKAWQEAYIEERKVSAAQRDMIARLVAVADVMEKFLQALPQVGDDDDT